MPSRVFSVDLGAWSVKLVIASPGIRGATLLHVVERRVPPGDEPDDVRARRVLTTLLDELRLQGESGYLAVHGDSVFTHILEFGFKKLRRADLVTAVGGELEGAVPIDLEDMVYCFEPILEPPPSAVAMIETGAVRGRVAPEAEGMRVLSFAMRRDRAEALLDLGRSAGFEPRGLLVSAGAAAKLVERVPSLTTPRSEGPVAVIDIGHERTNVVVVHQGRAVFSRSVARAGKNVTEAIAKHWRLDFDKAEAAKHADGFVASTAEPAANEAWARIHGVVSLELVPFARDLRHTLAACRARTGFQPIAGLLVGGGAQLRGLASFLTEQVGMQMSQITAEDASALVGPKLEGQVTDLPIGVAAMTIGMAFDCAGGRPQFDLRSGDLAVKVDLSFLRAKAAPLGAGLLVIAAFAAMSAYANLYRLRKAERTLSTRLASESQAVFDKAKTADEVLVSGGVGGGGGELSPMPQLSAYDVLLEINQHIPSKDKISLDVDKVEIDSQKIEIQGSAKTVDEIQLLVTELKKVECFNKKINQGPTETDSSGAKKFRLTIDSQCM
jgi:Tfp pilus assembly PilM family ATPase